MDWLRRLFNTPIKDLNKGVPKKKPVLISLGRKARDEYIVNQPYEAPSSSLPLSALREIVANSVGLKDEATVKFSGKRFYEFDRTYSERWHFTSIVVTDEWPGESK